MNPSVDIVISFKNVSLEAKWINHLILLFHSTIYNSFDIVISFKSTSLVAKQIIICMQLFYRKKKSKTNSLFYLNLTWKNVTQYCKYRYWERSVTISTALDDSAIGALPSASAEIRENSNQIWTHRHGWLVTWPSLWRFWQSVVL